MSCAFNSPIGHIFLVASLSISPLLFRPAAAADAPRPANLNAATHIVPPFVMKGDKGLDGFSIDLWNQIANRLKVKSTYMQAGSMGDLLDDVGSGRADLGVAAISITAERNVKYDFSQPMYEAGLQIMVRDEPHDATPDFVALLFSVQLLKLMGLILVLILIPAHIVYWFEKRHEQGIVAGQPYFPGIFRAAWWAAGTLATQADEMPKSPFGRVTAVVWMFASVVFVAYFTAAVTTSQTVQQLRGNIQGPGDLPGKRIATAANTSSAQYCRDQGLHATEFQGIEGTYRALQNHDVDAVVYDAPVLQYYCAHDGNGKANVVGPIFRKESYGIVFRNGSPLRQPVNDALLKLRENGSYDKLLAKWFDSGDKGSDGGGSG